MKHAGAGATVSIDLGHDREGIRVTIADDGVGMDERTARAGDGLVGMRDRIGAVGGLLEITSAPGCGTTLRGSVPVSGLADGARSAAP
jgi:signal transduction histidine kinase